MYIIHPDHRGPTPLFVNACSTGYGVICIKEAYHTRLPPTIINEGHPMCHLKAVVALHTLAPKYWGQLVHLYMDSATAAAIL